MPDLRVPSCDAEEDGPDRSGATRPDPLAPALLLRDLRLCRRRLTHAIASHPRNARSLRDPSEMAAAEILYPSKA
jgi:hypothetical protein